MNWPWPSKKNARLIIHPDPSPMRQEKPTESIPEKLDYDAVEARLASLWRLDEEQDECNAEADRWLSIAKSSVVAEEARSAIDMEEIWRKRVKERREFRYALQNPYPLYSNLNDKVLIEADRIYSAKHTGESISHYSDGKERPAT